MIGTNIRSVRHLYRVSDASLKTILVKFKEDVYDICKVIKTSKDSSFGENIFIFNNVIRQSHWSYDTISSTKEFHDLCRNELGHYCRVISVSPQETEALGGYFNEITLLPNSFEKDYDKFLKENSKVISNLRCKYGFGTNDINIKRLYIYTDNSKNFFQWAVTALYHCGISMATIKSILIWNESYKQLSKNLSKGTITAYTTRDSILMLLDELAELRKEKRINDSISSFNTTQKKLLKANTLSDDTKQALWRFSRLSETKKINFIKKMSSVDDFKELTRQLRFVTSVHFDWSKESFMDFLANVEGIKYEKIFENDNIVLVKTLDYETIKQLGKTTNWCISKNKHYWNNYIENYHGATTQYMIFDFSKMEDDKLSIIGFTTTRNKGITSAHNFVNEPLMGPEENDHVLLESFVSRFKENRNIFSILSNIGVDITLVVHYDTPPYKWDKENLMKYLYECVDKENVDVLTDNGDKMVLSVVDENIRYFLGDGYYDNISSDYWNDQHILFIDFSKNKYDSNKLQFAIIEEGCGDEDYAIGVFNERSLNNGSNFDSKLLEFGLPYNTIRRTNNLNVRLRNAISSYNTPMIKDCMKECDKNTLKRVIKNEFGSDTLYDMITRTIRSYVSFDYLNLFYDNGLSLKEFMSVSYIGDIIKTFIADISSIARAAHKFNKLQAVSDNDIEALFNRSIDNREDAKYVGLYIAIKKIISTEHFEGHEYNELFKRSTMMISSFSHGDIFEQIIGLGIDKIDFSRADDCVLHLARYAALYGSDTLKEFVEKSISNNDRAKKVYNSAKEEANKIQSITVNGTHGTDRYVYAFADALDVGNEHPF